MAEAFLRVLLENLNSLIGERVGLLLGVDKEMNKLSSMLSTIGAVLEDAEERQLTDRAVKDWLRKLSDVSFELDDVLDDCKSEADGLEEHILTRKVRSFLSSFNPRNAWFRLKIAKKMRDIRGRLEDIANERIKFHLRESVGESGWVDRVRKRRETSSVIVEPCVYGRDEDREKLVGFLLNDAVRRKKDVSIFTIVGLGGLGKTTLAQLVYNDERIKKHFELKMWLCVSNDFDVKRLVRAIIESASGTSCEALDMDPLQMRLQGELRGKRFLLVLDDVWNEDQDQWERLKYVLACGSSGSSLVVTTRLKRVASIMGTVPMHHLSGLSEDECWLLFKQRAFGSEREEHPSLVKIGKEIVTTKCKGSPLAAKALGSLMRYKNNESEWLSVMQSELWNLPEDKIPVLPALRLSYFHLPVEQRRCFAYCAVFPKDHMIRKKQLIQLWMANGLIYSKRGLEVEDIGSEIFDELCWRSFIEDDKVYWDGLYFKMHDLVHDLAQSVMEDECHVVEVDNDTRSVLINLPRRVKHLTCKGHLGYTSIEITSAQHLRTFLGLNNQSFELSHLKFSSLRAFDAKILRTSTRVSSLIGHLKHLRYLNLSRSDIKMLPESVCSFHHLLTLDVSHCSRLQKLPKNMCRLKGLRHLYAQNCCSLVGMPPNIGQLTSLKTLTTFIVNNEKGHRLNELGHLNIGGVLEIRNLDKIGSAAEAKSANLSSKNNLRELHLYWNQTTNESQENVEQVLEALAPSQNLTSLKIYNYKGVSLPCWLTLASLRDLKLSSMKVLQYIDNGESKPGFMELESLRIKNLTNLERLSRVEGREKFPRLSKLYVDNCPKLKLPSLESIKNIEIYKVTESLLNSISNFRGLTNLRIESSDNITSLPEGMLKNITTLQTLTIDRFTKLQELPADLLVGVNALDTLDISFCHELKCLPEGLFQSTRFLNHLTIKRCKKLKSLCEDFRNLNELQSLTLIDCPMLEGFPSSLDKLFSLKNLSMSGISLEMGGYRGYSWNRQPSQKLALLPEALQNLPSLESMTISYVSELASLPDWLGNLESLQELSFIGCRDLGHIPNSIKRLTNLQKLTIESSPNKLEERCKEEAGEDWHKIAHIPYVYVGPDRGLWHPL